MFRQVLQAHGESSSLRGISRTTGLVYNTVVSIVGAASQRAQQVHNAQVQTAETLEVPAEERKILSAAEISIAGFSPHDSGKIDPAVQLVQQQGAYEQYNYEQYSMAGLDCRWRSDRDSVRWTGDVAQGRGGDEQRYEQIVENQEIEVELVLGGLN